jgi:hypothetical protein
MASPDDHLDETQIRFQEAFGARHFRQGKPRAILEVKDPNIPTAIYEAGLGGFDQAEAAKENVPRTRRRTKAKRREKGDG